MWPGGKPRSDSIINMMGDTIFFIIGFMSAQVLDRYGNNMGWYEKHIK